MLDIVAQVLYEVGVRVVCHDDLGRAVSGADQGWKAGAGTQLENGFVLDESGVVRFEEVGESAAGLPEEVALLRYALVVRWSED